MPSLQRIVTRAEDDRGQTNDSIRELADKLAVLGDQMRAGQGLMIRLGEAQIEMKPVLERLAAATEREHSLVLDDVSRRHLRNIDIYAARILNDAEIGRASRRERG